MKKKKKTTATKGEGSGTELERVGGRRQVYFDHREGVHEGEMLSPCPHG